jgi:GrpB-like predicted nucleotidyltransferase (UPF0157 family)
MDAVHFDDESVFRSRVDTIVAQEVARLQAVLPHADVQHIGGTSIPGALTKGDVDLVVRVSAAEFDAARTVLRGFYAINQPENWTPSFASFKDDHGLPLPFGAQLVVIGSADDVFITIRDRLSRDPAAFAAYNAIKRVHHGGDHARYRAAKTELIERLIANPAESNRTERK